MKVDLEHEAAGRERAGHRPHAPSAAVDGESRISAAHMRGGGLHERDGHLRSACGELRHQLIACLRQGRGTRVPRSRGTDRRRQIPDMVSIHVRPPEVNDRVMPGRWEGNLVKGAANKYSTRSPKA